MDEFRYEFAADLFTRVARSASGPAAKRGAIPRAPLRSVYRNAVKYRRFATGAAALRFAVEELGADDLAATVLEMDGERFASAAIRALYDSAQYPLPRSIVGKKS